MGDGTEQNPYTHEDVLRLIEENGGTAKGLDLSGKVFESGIDLFGLDLNEIILKKAFFKFTIVPPLSGAHLEEANLLGADLEEAILWYAHLEKANLSHVNLRRANLADAYLKKADLSFSSLEGAYLGGAHLEGSHLYGTLFFHDDAVRDSTLEYKDIRDAALEDTDWGNYVLGEENEGEFYLAVDVYRRLKRWHTNVGIYDKAGEFFFREMTVKRKEMKWWPNPFPRAWSKFISLICGYGERPLRVIGWAASVILGLALVYFLIGSTWEWRVLWNSLYFSAASFTALGYGSWLEITNDWIKGIGAFESFIGVFTMALFLITFVRKMTR